MYINIKRLIYLILNIFVISFIFYNSFKNGEDSSNASSIILNIINNFFDTLNLDIQFTGYFIRKMAHFIEFFVLGIFSTLLFNSFSKISIEFFGYPLFICTVVPILDEYIQSFSDGRASQVTDILLDFSGAIFGIIFTLIILLLIKIFKKDKKYVFYKGNYGFK